MLTNFHVLITKFNTDNIENNSNNMKQLCPCTISIGRKGVISSKSEQKKKDLWKDVLIVLFPLQFYPKLKEIYW